MKKKTIALYALHGFLGLKKEWCFLDNLSDDISVIPLSLFEEPFDQALFSSSFDELASAVQTYCQSKCPENAIPVLLGYSLGGRVALHCLENDKKFWKGAILVSTHPGLVSDSQKNARRKKDHSWIRDLKRLSWKEFLDKWNRQDVFAHSLNIPKSDCFDKESLCCALKTFSLCNQKPFFSFLSEVSFPLLFAVGGLDEKFLSIAKSLKASTKVEVWIARECGHRLAWDDKDLFQKKTKEFIEKVRSYADNDKSTYTPSS